MATHYAIEKAGVTGTPILGRPTKKLFRGELTLKALFRLKNMEAHNRSNSNVSV
jgi:hypothetical protein